jgi:hypothetical protein
MPKAMETGKRQFLGFGKNVTCEVEMKHVNSLENEKKCIHYNTTNSN